MGTLYTVWIRCMSSPRQWADVTAPCQQSRQRVLLLNPSFQSGPLAAGTRCRIHSCLCVRVEKTWLLQCNTRQSSKVYYCTITACTECSSETGHLARTAWPRQQCSTQFALAACTKTYNIQALLTHASCPQQSGAVLSGRQFYHHSKPQPWYTTSVCQQPPSATSN